MRCLFNKLLCANIRDAFTRNGAFGFVLRRSEKIKIYIDVKCVKLEVYLDIQSKRTVYRHVFCRLIRTQCEKLNFSESF